MTPNERDNRVVWTPGEKRGHVESFFLKLNDPAQGVALWIKFTILSPIGHPENAVGEVWGIFFDAENPSRIFACKQSWPIDRCRLNHEGGAIEMGNARFMEGHTAGELEDPSGKRLKWDLDFTIDQPPLHHFPLHLLYTLPFPRAKAKSPHPDSRFSGFFETHEQRYTLDRAFGMQGHNWGREHTHTYAWGHCNAFANHPHAVFEGLSGKLKLGSWRSPFLSIGFLRLEDEWIRFDRFGRMARQPVTMTTDSWQFSLTNGAETLEGRIWAPRERFAGLTYPNPNGEIAHCLNSKIADGELTLKRRGRTVVTLRAEKTFALEILVRHTDHGIPILV
ncbi:MAG: hypothetical protein D6795_19225 [Deltaproteobacteria bacterium]|nr:MAG: hypothetical protein D6795_19225 [Deltaproteobacteria bacterium]